MTDPVCAEVDGDVVIFLIGMRIHTLWKVWKWLPRMFAMPKMLKALGEHPELGMLHARAHIGLRDFSSTQYWSAKHLQAYAHAANKAHLPAWKAFNRTIGTGEDVGIWHETYIVPKGNLETMYVNMPPFGLGLVGTLHPATRHRKSAAGRLSEAGCSAGPRARRRWSYSSVARNRTRRAAPRRISSQRLSPSL